MINKLDRAIKKTQEYAKKYGQSLSGRQVWERLISEEVFQISDLRSQTKKKVWNKKESKFYKEKMKKAKELSRRIESKFIDILFIGVTGSVAAENPAEDDDIDLMIITRANKLWLTRIKLRIFIFVNSIPHRKYGENQKRDEFCFNLWLDEESLEIPEEKQNLKNGVDLILMKAVSDRNNTYRKLMEANVWVKKFLRTPYERMMREMKQNPPYLPLKRVNESKWEELINCLFYWPQRWWMRKKIVQEIVDEHRAFFHKK